MSLVGPPGQRALTEMDLQQQNGIAAGGIETGDVETVDIETGDIVARLESSSGGLARAMPATTVCCCCAARNILRILATMPLSDARSAPRAGPWPCLCAHRGGLRFPLCLPLTPSLRTRNSSVDITRVRRAQPQTCRLNVSIHNMTNSLIFRPRAASHRLEAEDCRECPSRRSHAACATTVPHTTFGTRTSSTSATAYSLTCDCIVIVAREVVSDERVPKLPTLALL